MTALDLLTQVAAALKARGHSAAVARQTELWSKYVLLARIHKDCVQVTTALVFNGHMHVVSPGCDSSTLTPGSRHATVDLIVAAIEKRMEARKASLPVPIRADAEVHDP